jgi:lipopolysaccharide/colanic/teichoic acid biosynthesis glycosyltransferase
MHPGAEQEQEQLLGQNEADGIFFKLRNDPRTTKVGRMLRRTSLDELPQLFNVLMGHMSLVGPRPAPPSEVQRYLPWHRRRLEVSPGITGLWQVSGRSELTFDEMVLLDLYYIENWSPLLDVQIILRTVPTVLLREGAY